jgi:hypothetical protein
MEEYDLSYFRTKIIKLKDSILLHEKNLKSIFENEDENKAKIEIITMRVEKLKRAIIMNQSEDLDILKQNLTDMVEIINN